MTSRPAKTGLQEEFIILSSEMFLLSAQASEVLVLVSVAFVAITCLLPLSESSKQMLGLHESAKRLQGRKEQVYKLYKYNIVEVYIYNRITYTILYENNKQQSK